MHLMRKVCGMASPKRGYVTVQACLFLLCLLLLSTQRGGSVVEAAEQQHPDTYVSIVMCGRHDDKRGDYAGRLQNSLDFLLSQAAKFRAKIEIIVVEWNPLRDGSRLFSLLRVPPEAAASVRIITVPREFHESVQGDTGQDFFEFMAKNVGARRARGKFVLFSNGDVLLSDDVMRMFGEERLDRAAFYRIARTELPGLMDPLSPLRLRMDAIEELLQVLGKERTCKTGEKECPGEYNRGICEAMGQIPERIAQEHLGDVDEGFRPAAGDFFLISRQVLHRMGGYHQVASTTHLDSMLVCKARGMPLRQIVLLRPCAMMHQRHPAPMQPLRFILPGWELTDDKCEEKADEARRFARGMPGGLYTEGWSGDGPSMDSKWGFPDAVFEERLVAEAGADDWQWYSTGLFEPRPDVSGTEIVKAVSSMAGMAGETRGELTRRRVLTVLAVTREHEVKESGINRWCAFEPYSRWVADEPTIPFHHWFDMFRSKTCREMVQMTTPVSPNRARNKWLDVEQQRESSSVGDGDGVYVSFVVSARHDDLRGDNVGRLQGFIDNVVWGCAYNQVPCEIVVVDWAPVEWIGGGTVHTTKLKDLLKTPAGSETRVRVITVDQSLHGQVGAGSGSSFLEFHAKNVGARRARGEFVVLTSSDVLLSGALFAMLGQRRLDRGSFYRMPRVDVPGLMDPLAPLGVRAAAIEALAGELGQGIAVCAEGARDCAGAYNVGVCEAGGGGLEGHAGLHDLAFTADAGDFLMLSKDALHVLGGHHQVPSTTGLAAFLVCKARGLPMRQIVLLPPCVLLHQSHPSPVASMRKALPGWEWSEQRCLEQEQEARSFAGRAGWRASVDEWRGCSAEGVCPTQTRPPSMDGGWGWPQEQLPVEAEVEEANEEHWQWWGQSGWRDAVELARTQEEEEEEAHAAEADAREGRSTGDAGPPTVGERQQGAEQRKRERVVFCLTSTAERIGSMAPAFRTVREQTLRPDGIYVSVADGVAVPDFVALDPLVTVLRHSVDLGPVHKLLDCARHEQDPGTAIITFDDDMMLDPRLAARLVEAADALPEAVVGFSGWNVAEFLQRSPAAFAPADFVGQHSDPSGLPGAVDVLEGYAGVLYRRALVDVGRLADYQGAPEAARYADDVWISGWLAADGVERVVVPLEEGRTQPMALEDMFSRIWRQATSQQGALKGHPHRAVRNQLVAAHHEEARRWRRLAAHIQ